MKYADDLRAKLKEQVEEWKEIRDGYLKTIEVEKQNIEDYTAEIDKDMAAGGATTETAIASLNREYAQKRLQKAEADLKAHYDRPLYTVEEYNAACSDILSAYKAEYRKRAEDLKQKVNEALEIIDEIKSLTAEGNACDSSIRSAIEETGTDSKKIRNDSHFYSGKLLGGILYQNEIVTALKEACRQLERRI